MSSCSKQLIKNNTFFCDETSWWHWKSRQNRFSLSEVKQNVRNFRRSLSSLQTISNVHDGDWSRLFTEHNHHLTG